MSGIKQWSKNVEVAANPSRRVRFLNLTTLQPIAAGSSLLIDVYAPVGFIAKVMALTIRYGFAGATLGTKSASMAAVGGTDIIGAIFGEMPFNKDLEFSYGVWRDIPSYTKLFPTTEAAQSIIFQQTYDEINPIRFAFLNSTDITDSGIEKRLRVWVMEEKIGG